MHLARFLPCLLVAAVISCAALAQGEKTQCPTLKQERIHDRISGLRKKHRQIFDKLYSRPTPSSLKFRDVDAMLYALGVTRSESAGSRVTFELDGQVIVIHAPHPSPQMKKSSVDSLRKFLTDLGYVPQ